MLELQMEVLNIVYIIATVVAVIALSVSGLLKFWRARKFITFRFTGDSCTALEDFEQNPYNSSLSAIIPCHELLSAKPVFSDVSSEIYNLVDEVNSNISSLERSISLKLPRVCNPFSAPPEYQFQPENCPAGTTPISKIPEVLEVFTCSDVCKDGEFIPASNFKIVEIYTTSIQSRLNVYSGMENLVECQMVKDAFSEIIIKHCKPLKRYVWIVWASMIFLSLVMVVLVLVWIIKACHEQDSYFADGSVRLDGLIANMVE